MTSEYRQFRSSLITKNRPHNTPPRSLKQEVSHMVSWVEVSRASSFGLVRAMNQLKEAEKKASSLVASSRKGTITFADETYCIWCSAASRVNFSLGSLVVAHMWILSTQ